MDPLVLRDPGILSPGRAVSRQTRTVSCTSFSFMMTPNIELHTDTPPVATVGVSEKEETSAGASSAPPLSTKPPLRVKPRRQRKLKHTRKTTRPDVRPPARVVGRKRSHASSDTKGEKSPKIVPKAKAEITDEENSAHPSQTSKFKKGGVLGDQHRAHVEPTTVARPVAVTKNGRARTALSTNTTKKLELIKSLKSDEGVFNLDIGGHSADPFYKPCAAWWGINPAFSKQANACSHAVQSFCHCWQDTFSSATWRSVRITSFHSLYHIHPFLLILFMIHVWVTTGMKPILVGCLRDNLMNIASEDLKDPESSPFYLYHRWSLWPPFRRRWVKARSFDHPEFNQKVYLSRTRYSLPYLLFVAFWALIIYCIFGIYFTPMSFVIALIRPTLHIDTRKLTDDLTRINITFGFFKLPTRHRNVTIVQPGTSHIFVPVVVRGRQYYVKVSSAVYSRVQQSVLSETTFQKTASTTCWALDRQEKTIMTPEVLHSIVLHAQRGLERPKGRLTSICLNYTGQMHEGASIIFAPRFVLNTTRAILRRKNCLHTWPIVPTLKMYTRGLTNEQVSLVNRVLRKTPQPIKDLWGTVVFDEAFPMEMPEKSLADYENNGNLEPMSFIKWLEKRDLNAAQRQMLIDARAEVADKGLTYQMCKVMGFIKTQDPHHSVLPIKDPRMVYQSKPQALTYLGPLVHSICARFKTYWTQQHWFTYTSGFDSLALGAIHAHKLALVDDHSRLTGFKTLVFIMDMKRCESCMGVDVHEAFCKAVRVWMKKDMSAEARVGFHLLENSASLKGVTRSGIRFECADATLSGSAHTSIIAAFCVSIIVHRLKCMRLFGAIQVLDNGDDHNLYVSVQPDKMESIRSSIIEEYLRFGFEVTMEVCDPDVSLIPFCSQYFWPCSLTDSGKSYLSSLNLNIDHNKCWLLGPRIGRFIAKYGVIDHDDNIPAQAIAASYCGSVTVIPYVGAIIETDLIGVDLDQIAVDEEKSVRKASRGKARGFWKDLKLSKRQTLCEADGDRVHLIDNTYEDTVFNTAGTRLLTYKREEFMAALREFQAHGPGCQYLKDALVAEGCL